MVTALSSLWNPRFGCEKTVQLFLSFMQETHPNSFSIVCFNSFSSQYKYYSKQINAFFSSLKTPKISSSCQWNKPSTQEIWIKWLQIVWNCVRGIASIDGDTTMFHFYLKFCSLDWQIWSLTIWNLQFQKHWS